MLFKKRSEFKRHSLFIYIFIATSVACTSVTKYSTNRFSTSETRGEGKTSFDTYVSSSYEFIGVDDPEAQRVTFDRARIRNSGLIGTMTAYGINKFIDSEIMADQNAPLQLAMKLQLLGLPENEAKARNLSVAIRFAQGLGYLNSKASHSKREYSTGTTTSNYELIVGFRPLDYLLIYTGTYYQSIDTSFSFKGGQKEEGTSNGIIKSLYLGSALKFGSKQLKLNLAKSNAQYNSGRTESTNEYFLGLGFSLLF